MGHLADAHFGRRAGENDVSGEQPRAFGEAGDDLGNREHHVRGVALLDLFAVDSSARFDAVRVLELVRDDQERAGRTEAGKGLSNCFSRIGAAAGTFILPMSVDSLGVGTTMLIAAGICVLGAVISQYMAPETKGLSLSDTSALLSKSVVK